MSNLKSQFATSSSAASHILKLEIPNRNTEFYVRLLFVFTVYHTFFYEDSHNLAIFAEKEDKTICLLELPYPLFPYKFFANVLPPSLDWQAVSEVLLGLYAMLFQPLFLPALPPQREQLCFDKTVLQTSVHLSVCRRL